MKSFKILFLASLLGLFSVGVIAQSTSFLTELTNLGTTPAADDVFLIHDDDAGIDKKVAYSDLSIPT